MKKCVDGLRSLRSDHDIQIKYCGSDDAAFEQLGKLQKILSQAVSHVSTTVGNCGTSVQPSRKHKETDKPEESARILSSYCKKFVDDLQKP